MHLLDHDVISQRYFYPMRRPLRSATMVHTNGVALGCASIHRGHRLTLLHFHGNGEVVGDYLPDFPDLMDDLGVNTFMCEYRGYGASTGLPALATMLDDVSALVEAAGSPERLVVMGRSVGSIYAIECVRRFPTIAGLILESGIADVYERVRIRVDPAELGVSEDVLKAASERLFNHRATLGSYEGPTLVLHATNDFTVSRTHAYRNASWAGGPSHLEVFPYGNHNTIFISNQVRYLEVLGSFLNALQ